MYFEWDAAKAAGNLKKHGISFEMAATVFDDPLHLSIRDGTASGEERWVSVGLAADRKTLVVVHAFRSSIGGESVRIISARLATKREKRQYEKGI